MATRTAPGAGLLKGLGITLKTMLKPAATQQYPHERPVLEPRTRGVIALMDENCTVCMLCARECPDWCIYIDSHKETAPPATEGGRARTRNMLDRFAIDFALCMYCGICVEVCPFDALWWSPEFEYAEWDQRNLLHEYDRPPLIGTETRELPERAGRDYNSLRGWADTVVPPPPLEEGAIPPAEVLDALAKHKNELAKADAAVLESERASEEAANPTASAPVLQELPPEPILADMKVEGAEIDQAVMDQLLADGKSERMARSKAKAAWVKAEKAKQLLGAVEAWKLEVVKIEAANAAATAAFATSNAGGADEAPAAPAKPILADMKVEGAEIDQAVMDQLLADGKSERMARSKAKAAWVKAEKAKLLEVALVEWEASYGAGAAAAAAPVAEPTLGSVQFEGEVEIDQDVYDDLISQGKSERIARAKAKAAFVKAAKQKMLDEAGDAGAADDTASDDVPAEDGGA